MNRPQWLDWTQRLQAIAQAGLAYTHDHFDAERFRELRKIAAEIMAAHTQADLDEVQMIFNAESGLRHTQGGCARRGFQRRQAADGKRITGWRCVDPSRRLG